MTQRERELLWERVSASLPPPEEGRVDNLLFQNLDRKRLSLSLGPKRAWRVVDGSTSYPTHPPSCQQAAVGGSRASSKATHTSDSCLKFGPADSQIILRPRPGYVPKVSTSPFGDLGYEPSSAAPRRRQTQPKLCLSSPSVDMLR